MVNLFHINQQWPHFCRVQYAQYNCLFPVHWLVIRDMCTELSLKCLSNAHQRTLALLAFLIWSRQLKTKILNAEKNDNTLGKMTHQNKCIELKSNVCNAVILMKVPAFFCICLHSHFFQYHATLIKPNKISKRTSSLEVTSCVLLEKCGCGDLNCWWFMWYHFKNNRKY